MKKTSMIFVMVLFVLGMNAWAQKVDKWQQEFAQKVAQDAAGQVRLKGANDDLLRIANEVITELRANGKKNKELEKSIREIAQTVAETYRKKAAEDRFAQLKADNPGAYVGRNAGRFGGDNFYVITFNSDGTYKEVDYMDDDGSGSHTGTGRYILDGNTAIIQEVSGRSDFLKSGTRLDLSGDIIASLKKAAAEQAAALAAINAKGVTAADFDYDLTRDGKGIIIKKYKGAATVVKIPAVIEGFPVKKIGGAEGVRGDTYGAFYGNKNITSVTIPDSVISMVGGQYGEGAFVNCTNLQSVILPRNITSIEEGTFRGCEKLSAITIPNGVTDIKRGAFEGCKSLESVTFPDSVTEIGESAFGGCDALTSIVLPRNLKSSYGFSRCKNLKSITIQSGEVGSWDCPSLTELTITGNCFLNAFTHCPITTVNIGPKVTSIRGIGSILDSPNAKLSIATKAALAKFR